MMEKTVRAMISPLYGKRRLKRPLRFGAGELIGRYIVAKPAYFLNEGPSRIFHGGRTLS
jgi:hypothetical protein